MTDNTQPPDPPQAFQRWCGYVIGAVFVVCVVAVFLAATVAAVRALLW